MRLAAALAILGVAAAARAHSVTNEAIVNTAQSTETNPRPSVFTDTLNASFDLAEDWTVSAGASLTLEGSTAAARTAGFNQSATPVTHFSAGLDWYADDHWMLGLSLDLSPMSTQFAVSSIPATPTATPIAAEVRSQTSQLGAGLDLSWDSSGHSELEWSFNAGLGFSHYSIGQSIPRVRTASGQTLTPAQFSQRYCAAHPRIRNCTDIVLDAFKGQQRPVDFERLSAGATATLLRDTDISLLADYYVYNQDPRILDYSLVAVGRGPGLPIAPLRYLIRPEVLHRFGDFTAKLWAEGGEYVAGAGENTAGLGARVQYRFTDALRAWVAAAGHRDVDASGFQTRSGSVSAGIGYRW